MIEPKQGYWCTECGNTYTRENVEMCAYGDCTEYVCPDCDGSYCTACQEIAKIDNDNQTCVWCRKELNCG